MIPVVTDETIMSVFGEVNREDILGTSQRQFEWLQECQPRLAAEINASTVNNVATLVLLGLPIESATILAAAHEIVITNLIQSLYRQEAMEDMGIEG